MAFIPAEQCSVGIHNIASYPLSQSEYLPLTHPDSSVLVSNASEGMRQYRSASYPLFVARLLLVRALLFVTYLPYVTYFVTVTLPYPPTYRTVRTHC